jgi:xanthine/uracil/vitamin C permease (AzgA family)
VLHNSFWFGALNAVDAASASPFCSTWRMHSLRPFTTANLGGMCRPSSLHSTLTQVTYQQALAAVFIEGWIFIAISLTGVRGKLVSLVPKSIMLATAGGIGLFLVRHVFNMYHNTIPSSHHVL